MADIEFKDNRVVVNRALDDAVGAFLIEASSEIVAAAARGSRVDTGDLKGSWAANINETKGEAVIGSPLENAIWEEFGTGVHAEKKNGRTGYWVFVKGSGTKGKNTGKSYSLETAKAIVASMRADGLDAYYTNGKEPNHTLQKAYDANKSKIIRRAEQIIKGKMS